MTVDPRSDTTRDFDAAAPTWDETPRRVQLARDVAAAIRRAVPLGPAMAVLDFGCGTGLVTLELAPHLARISGMDSSKGMLEVLERKSGGRIPAILLGPDELPALPQPVDGLVSSMTLHHVARLEPLFGAFFNLLVPGGFVALADLDAEDGSFHEDSRGVYHKGFCRSALLDLLNKAGFERVQVTDAAQVAKGGCTYSVFLAVAWKPEG